MIATAASCGPRRSLTAGISLMDAITADAHREAPLGRLVTFASLLWIAGVGLRLTILAVPPLVRLIHDDLHLSETGVGILPALPTVLFVFAAVPGSLMIARLGARTAVIAGLLATALGCAL